MYNYDVLDQIRKMSVEEQRNIRVVRKLKLGDI